MPHHILASSRGHLEATMVFNDLGICIHALRIGLGDYPQSDPCLWFRGEQLTGVLLLFLTYTDLLALQECVHIQSKS